MSRESFINRLKELGPQKVRENLLVGRYNPLEKPIVESWLKEEELEISKDANQIAKEANKISKSAKNAAWRAIWVSIGSILISLYALFKK
jgi:hypothetical protein